MRWRTGARNHVLNIDPDRGECCGVELIKSGVTPAGKITAPTHDRAGGVSGSGRHRDGDVRTKPAVGVVDCAQRLRHG